MADPGVEVTGANGVESRTHSRDSSVSSDWWRGEEDHNKENAHTQHDAQCGQDSHGEDVNCTGNAGVKLILHDGGKLTEESGTEMAGHVNHGFKSSSIKNGDDTGSMHIPEIPPRQISGGGTGTARHRVIKSGNMVSSIPEEEITIPNDGNLASFSADAMATFLRYLRLEDRLINHLHRNSLDGRRFGRLKDSDLENLKLNNPVVVYFRDRTAPAVTKKHKPRLPFVL